MEKKNWKRLFFVTRRSLSRGGWADSLAKEACGPAQLRAQSFCFSSNPGQAVGRKARGERGHRVLVFPRTATWIGSFSGIKAGPACSGFGHLAHGMDALLYNSPVAGRASPDPHCQWGSPVSADLGDVWFIGRVHLVLHYCLFEC